MDLVSMGRRVKQRRQELGLDQTDVAKQIGRTRGYVSRLEAGKSGENLKDLVAVSKVLGMTLSDLIGETDEALLTEVRRRLPDGSELAISFERIARGMSGQAESDQTFLRAIIKDLAERFGESAPEAETPDDPQR